MSARHHTHGLLLLVLLAGVGYLLVSLPPTVIGQYKAASELGEAWGYAYLVLVGSGGALLAIVSGMLLLRWWRAGRRKAAGRARRGQSPSELSRADQERELRDNLAAGEEFTTGEEVAPEVRAEIKQQITALESKLQDQRLEIVAFGTISSGKSSLLNALAGREVFRSDVAGGTTLTRSEIPWPGHDRVVLTDTPGLAEVEGEARAVEAADVAREADLVLAVVDGPLKAYEVALLRQLASMEKRVLVCLNKEDWFSPRERDELVGQIRQQVAPQITADDVLTISARPSERRRVRVLPDGREAEEAVPTEPDIEPLARRMLEVVERDGSDLLVANLLLKSRGLVDDAKGRVREALDARAEELVSKYMWAAGGAAAVNPIPLLDLAGGSAISVKMVLDLARVYRQEIDVDTVIQLLSQLSKNLIAMLGATAATPAVAALVASMLKTVPGVGTIAGGLVQGLVQALVTRWIGRVFIEYFHHEMEPPPGGLAELARRSWDEVTAPGELLKLIQTGRRRLTGKES